MSDPQAPRCAIDSRGHDEPLVATASRVRRWLLVEQPGPWGRQAPLDSRMDDLVARSLLSSSQRLGFRVLLVRRPRWRRPTGSRIALLARTDAGGGWVECVPFDDPRSLLDLDMTALESKSAPGVGTPGPEMLSLVCTNGRHDACCADRGRPVVRALAEAKVPDVWETTHVGGDRFAANIVCLPSGVYLGRVEPEDAAEVLAQVRDGLLPLENYRGRSCYQPLVQAAEWFARRKLDERRLFGLRVIVDERLGENERRVTFEVEGGGQATVTVERTRAEDSQQLTCAAGNTGRPWRYNLLSFEP